MKRIANLSMALTVGALGFAVYQPVAHSCEPPPPECAAGRNLSGFNSGMFQGKSIVLQIWRSPAVGQNPDNWDKLDDAVQNTIKPLITATLARTNIDDYTRCRVQGMLEGTLCQMGEINPIPGCQWSGAVWGDFSAFIYCGVSIGLGGLSNGVPWFIRIPPGMCGTGFQNYCEATFRYGANHEAFPLSTEMEAELVSKGYDPISSLWQPAACVPYTVDTPEIGFFQTVFADSVYVDCTYNLPPLP